MITANGRTGITGACYAILQAASGTPVRLHACGIHNQRVLFAWCSLVISSSSAASGLALGPIVVARFFVGGLTDGLSACKSRQIWLLDASRGICACLLPFRLRIIHNCWLWIVKSWNVARTRDARRPHTHITNPCGRYWQVAKHARERNK